jgi:hypothetical protein
VLVIEVMAIGLTVGPRGESRRGGQVVEGGVTRAVVVELGWTGRGPGSCGEESGLPRLGSSGASCPQSLRLACFLFPGRQRGGKVHMRYEAVLDW